MTASGFLAIWSDVAPADETNYLHWLTREHVAERLEVPGFLSARVFRARIEWPRYLILYSLQDPSILTSDAYLERLNNPSEWTRRVMPILSNFKRGGGTIRLHTGWGCGGIIAPLTDPQFLSIDITGSLSSSDGITAISVLDSDLTATTIATKEKALRSQDQTFERLIIVEATAGAAIIESLGSIHLLSNNARDYSLYELVFCAH